MARDAVFVRQDSLLCNICSDKQVKESSFKAIHQLGAKGRKAGADSPSLRRFLSASRNGSLCQNIGRDLVTLARRAHGSPDLLCNLDLPVLKRKGGKCVHEADSRRASSRILWYSLGEELQLPRRRFRRL